MDISSSSEPTVFLYRHADTRLDADTFGPTGRPTSEGSGDLPSHQEFLSGWHNNCDYGHRDDLNQLPALLLRLTGN